MVNFMLSAINERERQILVIAFKQRGINVLLFKPSYQFYVKMLQYLPDIIILEIPHLCKDQLHFIKLIKKHKKMRKIIVMGYGNPIDGGLKRGILKHGVHEYFERPLKFSELIKWAEPRLQAINKTIETPKEESDIYTDTKLLLSSETLPTKKVEIMAKYVSNLLAFPFTVTKALKITQDEKSGARDLAKVIEADPVITADILKVSNSVFFASSNRTITSIKDAVVRIGFLETKRIVMGMSVMDILSKENRNSGFNRIDFWYHSLACAIICERVAKRMGTINPEEAFLAGLLHDFGILILDNFFPDIFSQILEKTANESAHFIDKESEILGISHNDVVKELFSEWKMPADVAEGIVSQYDFLAYKGKLNTPSKKLAFCVGLGNILAKTVYLGRGCDQFIRAVDNWVFNTIKMPKGFTQDFLDTIYRDINLYRQFLKLEEREFPQRHEGLDKAEEKRIGVINLAKDIFVPPLLYFKKEGIQIEMVSSTEKYDKLDSRFDMILIWAGEDTSPKKIEELTRIVKYYGESRPEEKEPELAPLLVCVRDDSTLPNDESLKGISFMGQMFDLRHLDRNISEILMGKVIPFSLYKVESTTTEDVKESKLEKKEEPIEDEHLVEEDAGLA